MHPPLQSTTEPIPLAKGQRVRLSAVDENSVFEITGAKIVWNQTNAIDGRQLLIMEIEVERDVPKQEFPDGP